MWAATRGDVAEVKRILEAYPDRVDNPDEEGSTPLIAAAWTNKLEVVKTLLEHKADIHRANRTVRILSVIMPTDADSIVADSLRSSHEMRSCGLNASFSTCGRLRETVLYETSTTGNVGGLSRGGCVPHLRSSLDCRCRWPVILSHCALQYAWTALHAAAAKGHAEMVQLLLDHKADPLKCAFAAALRTDARK